MRSNLIPLCFLSSCLLLCPLSVLIAEDKIEAATSTQAVAPELDVRDTIDRIVDIVEKAPGDSFATQRREEMRKVINPRFDFEEMAKRSLGKHWKDRNPEEQREFISVFSDLLARTYLSKIETVKRGMVKVQGSQIEFPRALVRTIVTSKGDEFPIEYKMLNIDGKWKVYDVVVENIGLVANYRNEFDGLIRKDKFEGLMKKLRDKQAS